MVFLENINALIAHPLLMPMGSAAGLVLLALISVRHLSVSRRRKRQRWRISASYHVLDRVGEMPAFPHKISYLRKIDPFLFEEVILTALELYGCRIKRNRRYTMDGGLDGQFWYRGQRYLVQAKRYRGYISKSHIAVFESLCRKRRALGLFVHTGKTGKGIAASETESVSIISGQALLGLLEGRGISTDSFALPASSSQEAMP